MCCFSLVNPGWLAKHVLASVRAQFKARSEFILILIATGLVAARVSKRSAAERRVYQSSRKTVFTNQHAKGWDLLLDGGHEADRIQFRHRSAASILICSAMPARVCMVDCTAGKGQRKCKKLTPLWYSPRWQYGQRILADPRLLPFADQAGSFCLVGSAMLVFLFFFMPCPCSTFGVGKRFFLHVAAFLPQEVHDLCDHV